MRYKTREQLGEQVNSVPYSYYNKSMIKLCKDGLQASTVGFHSDVYYVRAALEKHTGLLFPLPKVEAAMRAEGWREGGVNRRYF